MFYAIEQVRYGKLLKTIKWDFIRIQNEFWRYHNTAMDDDHLTVVMPESESYYVYGILYNGLKPEEAVNMLMNRARKNED